MTHIDEGTIHAWLDGAVDATQAREIEAHVAQCPTCSAAVAKARGLIAGASRILTALDDVPAGVMPAGSLASAPKRQWRAARWVTGIAAALILAVGVTTWNRKGAEIVLREEAGKENARNEVPATRNATPTPPAPSVATVPAFKMRPAAVGGARSANAEARAARAVHSQAATPAPPLAGGMIPSASAKRADAGGNAVARLAREPSMQSREPSLKAANIAATDAAVEHAEPMASPDVIAGCYRLPSAGRIDEVVATSSAATGAPASVRRGAAAGALGPQSAKKSAAYAQGQVQEPVRLEAGQRSPDFAVRDTRDSLVGSWSRIGGDSVRVTLFSAGSYTVSTKDRVTCPSPPSPPR